MRFFGLLKYRHLNSALKDARPILFQSAFTIAPIWQLPHSEQRSKTAAVSLGSLFIVTEGANLCLEHSVPCWKNLVSDILSQRQVVISSLWCYKFESGYILISDKGINCIQLIEGNNFHLPDFCLPKDGLKPGYLTGVWLFMYP